MEAQTNIMHLNILQTEGRDLNLELRRSCLGHQMPRLIVSPLRAAALTSYIPNA